MKSVMYLREDRNIEVVLVLPHPNVPLRLVAPDNLSAPKAAEARILDRQCPGPERVYLGHVFESPELAFMRSLDVET